LWYAAEGDYTNAALSGAAIIPVVGDIGGKGFRQGKKLLKGAKALDKANDARRLYRRTTSTAEAAENLVRSSRKLDDIPALARNASKTDDVFEAASRELHILNNPKCFPAGTPVSTESGQKPIEQVQPGERVWAYSLGQGEWALRPVLETYEFLDRDFVRLQVGGEQIVSTAGHPFWVIRGDELNNRPRPEHIREAEQELLDGHSQLPGRWVDATDLQPGDVLFLRDGRQLPVESVELFEELQPTYNFAVGDLHTYAVGTAGILVHNNCGDGFFDVSESMSNTARNYQRQVTGTAEGKAYFKNGTRFDGYDNGTLLEAKGPGYDKLLKDPELQAKVGNKLLKQARNQLDAADGAPIKWIVAEKGFAKKLRKMFKINGNMPIQVVYQPMKI